MSPPENFNFASLEGGQQVTAALQVHRPGEGVPERLEDQRVVRNFNVGSGGVVLASDLGREDGRQQVVGPHPLQRRRDLAAAGMAQDRQGPRGGPTPPGPEHRGL